MLLTSTTRWVLAHGSRSCFAYDESMARLFLTTTEQK